MSKKKSAKFYQPLFSIIIIVIQLILSVVDYFEFQEWKKSQNEIYDLLNVVIRYDKIFLFVLTIGIYEMLTKPSMQKIIIRVLLICIVLGYNLAEFIPIDDFDSGVYNTAWFLAIISSAMIAVHIVSKLIKKHSD
jgi:hypothetical protein